jgi:hypothetical protein
MKKILEKAFSWSFLLFGILTFLILGAEPPTGPADEPYIEHEIFIATWGQIILWTWLGLLATTISSAIILKFKYKF